MNGGGAIAPVLTINGQPASAALLNRLTGLSVDRGLGLVGRATLRFVEGGFELAALADFDLGTQVSIKLQDGSVLLSGEVTGVSLDQQATSHSPSSELLVTVDDRAAALGRETKNRSFLSVKYSEVISTMASESGLRAEVESTTDVHEYLLQTGSDLSYLGWITARCGLVWWMDDATLVVKQAGTSVGTVRVRFGPDLYRFSTRASGLHPRKVTVTGWDDAQQQSISFSANTTLSTASPELVAKYPGRDSRGSDKGLAVADHSPLTMNEAQQVGEALLAESFGRAVTARGTCPVNGRITPATTVEVAGTGSSAGSYLVSRVEHVYDATGFHTHFTAGPLRPTNLVDLLGAPAEPSGAVMSGLVPAVVTDNNDPEKFGRAKVKFTTMDGSVESWWARVVTQGGGKSRGVVFQPEINDEVLVGFEQGDTRRPVILGGLFSKNIGLPTGDNVDERSKVTHRRINSRLGHVIELADGDGDKDQYILLQIAGTTHRIRLGKDRLDIEVDRKPVLIKNGDAKVEFTDAGDVTIQGNNVTIKATANLKVEAGSELGLKGTTTTNVQAGATLDMKSQGLTNVQGQGGVTVKGATVAIN